MIKRKRKSNKLLSLILSVCGLATAALSFISLFLTFITYNNYLSNKKISTNDYDLQGWFGLIDDFQKVDDLGKTNHVASWQVARVFVFATLILVGVLALLILVKMLLNNRLVNICTILVGIVTVFSAIILMITTISGCDAVSTTLLLDRSIYSANVGVYLLSIGAILTAILAEGVAIKK